MALGIALNEIGLHLLDNGAKNGSIEILADVFGFFIGVIIEMESEESFFFAQICPLT